MVCENLNVLRQGQRVKMKMSIEHLWSNTDSWKPKYWEKKLYQCLSVHQKSRSNFLRIEPATQRNSRKKRKKRSSERHCILYFTKGETGNVAVLGVLRHCPLVLMAKLGKALGSEEDRMMRTGLLVDGQQWKETEHLGWVLLFGGQQYDRISITLRGL